MTSRANSRFVRLAETARPTVELRIDGERAQSLAGDTLVVALLTNARRVRDSEFGDGQRADFCLMGACQDCWVWTGRGGFTDTVLRFGSLVSVVMEVASVRQWRITSARRKKWRHR
jgi:2Fe-2S iron-sulfur cluster binding domain